MNRTLYVCGFCFDSTLTNVALIQKKRGPANMAGKFNGIGGKMELGESARGAQSREFSEEAGVLVPPEAWSCFHTERYIETGHVVYFMTASTINFQQIRTLTDEEVVTFDVDSVWDMGEFMYNLNYLVPMARSWMARPKDRYFES